MLAHPRYSPDLIAAQIAENSKNPFFSSPYQFWRTLNIVVEKERSWGESVLVEGGGGATIWKVVHLCITDLKRHLIGSCFRHVTLVSVERFKIEEWNVFWIADIHPLIMYPIGTVIRGCIRDA